VKKKNIPEESSIIAKQQQLSRPRSALVCLVMGVDAGILVTQQITDEHKWFVAMEEVRREFEREDYFKEMPDNCCNLNEKMFEMLETTEPINFSHGGKFFAWYWKDIPDLVTDSKEKIRSKEISLKDALCREKYVLEQKMREEPDSRVDKPFGPKEKLEDVKLALEIVERCGAKIEFEEEFAFTEPPILYEFCVKEHPTLPLFGRHFRLCSSKIQLSWNASPSVERILETIFKILKKHFPRNVCWFNELMDDCAFLDEKYFRKDSQGNQLDGPAQRFFYENAPKLFKGVQDKECLLKARTELVRVMLTMRFN